MRRHRGAPELRAEAARVEPGPGDLAAGTAVVRSVASTLLAPLLAAHPGANASCSPLSITLALGMLRAGVEGDSALELDTLLGLDGSAVPAALNAVGRRLTGLDGGKPKVRRGFDDRAHVTLANAFWGQEGIIWREGFPTALAADYDTGVHTVDYAADPDGCRLLINAWVKEQTSGRIPQLLTKHSVTSAHVLALTNAWWFKARWRYPFDSRANGPFTLSSGSRVDLPRMRVSWELLAYGSGPGWQSVQISYVGGQLAMVVVLPDLGMGESVERMLSTPFGMLALLRPSEMRTVDLTMPLFDIDTPTALLDVLSAVGVRSAFVAGTTDLAPMTADADIWIDQVAHQSTVTVDEEGTEAAAATVAMGVALSASIPENPITIVVDRPFYFAITTTDDVLPLFIGRVTDPTST